ncbi:MAG: hypothetical protein DRO06_04155 [Thermoproteota archaeon]|nr:MAG: hypothetical protein DRO06_04155 [Candidatus Korarchaeota archaeon]
MPVGVEFRDVGLPESLYCHPLLRRRAWERTIPRWAEASEAVSRVARSLEPVVGQEVVTLTLEPFGAPSNLSLYLMERSGLRIRLGDVGDGVQSLATLMLLYEFSRPRALLVDDVESHMNPSALSLLASWLLSRVEEDGISLLASTHSMEAALLLGEVFRERARVVILALEEGRLRSRALTVDELDELRRAGLDARSAEGVIL